MDDAQLSAELIEWLDSVRDKPLAFAMGAFPWGEPGTVLETYPDGPSEWQRQILLAIETGLLTPWEAIQLATASGHGIGKSALVSIIILWAFMTYPDCRGVITANTETQLKTKTWAELGKWFNLCFFAREHFTLTATGLFSKDPDRERTWRIDMIPWSEKNPTAFAGLHNKGKRLLLIFDEASEIPDIIWETAEGALTDTDT
ncbi:MAG: terminase, partial [Desulfurellales bacterium]